MPRGERWEILSAWFDHPLWKRVNQKGNDLVTSHGWNLVHADRRWALTVQAKTDKVDWTIAEARAFLRDRMGWTIQTVMLSIFETYSAGRCVADCRHCNGAPFFQLGLEKMSLDILNPRSALPRWGHATAWRCKDYNTSKGGRCLDEFIDDLFMLESFLESTPESDAWCPAIKNALPGDQRLW